MILERTVRMLAAALSIAAGSLTGAAGEEPAVGKDDPPWDGKETVAEYAERAKLEPAMTLDLGDGVKMELALIPAGKFVMGSPEGEKELNAFGLYDMLGNV